ncbi:hypothetical protein TNCT_82471 [Trichonephila clavata]|uniref:Uncharacterized protein n=1 Tax=Trichonephila clavata TaxID=2740835 RepID=A0A8X6H175_TRICU|nr:hypothetical protein TNCT_82471 [Trichonephila clavata]
MAGIPPELPIHPFRSPPPHPRKCSPASCRNVLSDALFTRTNDLRELPGFRSPSFNPCSEEFFNIHLFRVPLKSSQGLVIEMIIFDKSLMNNDDKLLFKTNMDGD